MKLLKLVGIAAGIIVILALVVGIYLLGSEDVPETTSYEIHLSALRDLARTGPGQGPIEVRYEIIGNGGLPRGLIMAGGGFELVEMPRPVFQVLYPDGHYILIDSAYDRSQHEAANFADQPFFDEAWDKLVVAMDGADKIVVTHEHGDHLGGVASHPRFEDLARSLLLTEEQLSSEGAVFTKLPETLRARLEPLRYENAVAIAPGVVLRKAPGHTPGSQMVFVTLADGKELLFVGDVVWNLDAVTELKYRPRLITDLILGEDRKAVLDQLRALRNLHDAGRVPIVVSHDRRTYQQPGLREGFVLGG